MIWRYFVTPLPTKLAASQLDEREFTARFVIRINHTLDGAYIFSSGKNMGVFKANGFPEDVGEYYMLENYEAYSWTCHGRYPTNTPGWWGGAAPFCAARYHGRPQRRDLVLRRKPPLHPRCSAIPATF